MIIYIGKNQTPNIICDKNNTLNMFESIKAGENITIELDKENKTMIINSTASAEFNLIDGGNANSI